MEIYIYQYEHGVSLESLIILYVYKNCFNDVDVKNVEIFVVDGESDCDDLLFQIECSDFKRLAIADIPDIAHYCKWPVAIVDHTVIAGLAAVARRLLQYSNDVKITALLGFRSACLLACNEVSVWTKFCEVDMIVTVKHVIRNLQHYAKSTSICLPVQLTRFEYHMSVPIRIHNIYKLARLKNNDNLLKSSTPVGELNLDHTYSEGPFMTLADLLLFPCFKIIFEVFGQTFENELPLTNLWYKNLCRNIKQLDITCEYKVLLKNYTITQEVIDKQSLYKGESRQNRNYTQQEDVVNVLAVTKNLLVTNTAQYVDGIKFAWENLPLGASPFSGALPKVRANRKCEQLENLARATIKIASNKSYVIVDFCSGSGHLGIILACALPKCHIILVENKERSLQRAQERIFKMNLKNITVVQSNLDYFIAPFNIGTALHACGVATDLVIKACINSKADFVVCPCCYGGIRDCHHLSYPRSKTFKAMVSYEEYLILGHASDQTHDTDNAKTSQGFTCMDVIDSDRKLAAEEYGYTVYLNKLIPTTCTPKNNLLIGICK